MQVGIMINNYDEIMYMWWVFSCMIHLVNYRRINCLIIFLESIYIWESKVILIIVYIIYTLMEIFEGIINSNSISLNIKPPYPFFLVMSFLI